ncbi:Phospholipid/glycerol acyltransferase [Artemisia annua]|uniref:Phospholipid/glycerol acyltransferase n=1 Tax=Artemisia annua TaxID=35608 RepID=A0A2U1LYV6_ARTAN|nr:Phospholipid/glycerol acyltransferase [Artemisia annua]
MAIAAALVIVPIGVLFFVSGLIVNLIQAIIFVVVRPFSKSLFRRLNRMVAELLWLELVWIVDCLLGNMRCSENEVKTDGRVNAQYLEEVIFRSCIILPLLSISTAKYGVLSSSIFFLHWSQKETMVIMDQQQPVTPFNCRAGRTMYPKLMLLRHSCMRTGIKILSYLAQALRQLRQIAQESSQASTPNWGRRPAALRALSQRLSRGLGRNRIVATLMNC